MLRFSFFCVALFCFGALNAQNKIAASSAPDTQTPSTVTPQLAASGIDSTVSSGYSTPAPTPKLAAEAQDAPYEEKDKSAPAPKEFHRRE